MLASNEDLYRRAGEVVPHRLEASSQVLCKEDYDKAVVITDGWASMKKENLAALKKRKVKTLTILLSRSHKEPDCFKELGSIIKLKDAVI